MREHYIANFELRSCSEKEHRVVCQDDEQWVFRHLDGSECRKMHKMQGWELTDTMEPIGHLSHWRE